MDLFFYPFFSTTLGIIPESSALYDWIKTYLLPPALILLLLSANLPALAKLGSKAVFMMLIGTIGVVVGGAISLALFGPWLQQMRGRVWVHFPAAGLVAVPTWLQ
ncbi:MAG: hypothetical protein CM1200mP10_32720 [Candidatus Neomarinimicrobiota bacterium]|nr:MAG: hypothetical protein CM1200mP10_32720 [Candidatus Neomarinimicrobiota bacterium]